MFFPILLFKSLTLQNPFPVLNLKNKKLSILQITVTNFIEIYAHYGSFISLKVFSKL